MCKRKQFQDMDRGLKVGETDERVILILVIFVMVSFNDHSYYYFPQHFHSSKFLVTPLVVHR